MKLPVLVLPAATRRRLAPARQRGARFAGGRAFFLRFGRGLIGSGRPLALRFLLLLLGKFSLSLLEPVVRFDHMPDSFQGESA
jgi:hypothetical protein